MSHGQKLHLQLADMTLITPQAEDGAFSAAVIFLGHKYCVTRNEFDQPLKTVEEAETAAKMLARAVFYQLFEKLLESTRWAPEDEV